LIDQKIFEKEGEEDRQRYARTDKASSEETRKTLNQGEKNGIQSIYVTLGSPLSRDRRNEKANGNKKKRDPSRLNGVAGCKPEEKIRASLHNRTERRRRSSTSPKMQAKKNCWEGREMGGIKQTEKRRTVERAGESWEGGGTMKGNKWKRLSSSTVQPAGGPEAKEGESGK